MRTSFQLVTLLLAALTSTIARAQPNAPHLAYVYPAGGRQGTVVEVTVGGQNLRGITNAFIADEGIEAAVLEYNRPLNQKEFKDLREEWTRLQEKRRQQGPSTSGTNAWTTADQARLGEIRSIILKNPPNRQANPAMAETILLRVSLATNAEPGEHEIRLRSLNAISNPLHFYVGQLPEYSKAPARATDPNIARFLERLGGNPATNTPQSDTRISLPAVVNGQIMPGGVDRCRFFARQGQQLVVDLSALALIPYLADAVPGWFEAVATLYDSRGRELSWDDRSGFRPDPALHFTAPGDGDYIVAIHDSIFRGREDFVYRLTIGELPYLKSVFPLGAQVGSHPAVELTGWNLPTNAIVLDNASGEPGITRLSVSRGIPNPVCFAMDTLPECIEHEPDNSPRTAQPVTLPVIVNGRIDSPGDEDVFQFSGRAGQRVVAEILAHRLGSPLDSSLELSDIRGNRIAFNDDFDDESAGLETDHADSYLAATIPADGIYLVRLRDVRQRGGREFAYRLRLSEPRPDFALRIEPSSLNARAGLNVPVTAHAQRKDGFTNAIDIRLVDAPPGFSLQGARIPANRDSIQFTMRVPPRATREPLELAFDGVATTPGRSIVHPAVPADNRMQAFAYWHLVPAQKLVVAVAGNPRAFGSSALRIQSDTPVKIPAGGKASVRIATPSPAFADRFDLELNDPMPGINVQSVSPTSTGVEVVFECDAAKSVPGAVNLVLNIVPRAPASTNAAPAAARRNRSAVGALPAIPCEIIAQSGAPR